MKIKIVIGRMEAKKHTLAHQITWVDMTLLKDKEQDRFDFLFQTVNTIVLKIHIL